MRSPWLGRVVVVLLFASVGVPAAAAEGRSLVRIRSGLDGWSTIASVCSVLGCQVVRSLDTLPDETLPSSLFLVEDLPAITVDVQALLDSMGVEAVEPDLLLAVASDGDPSWATAQATGAVLDTLQDRTPVAYYQSSAWRSYVQQPASEIVRVRDAHCALRATGGGVVAVIDTGVDRDHPTLAPVLTAGYDFTRNAHGGDEKADVDQATAAVLDGVYLVNQATAAVLDQATGAVLDDPGYSHFGHGTMVAGVVHLVAPTAQIMPLKAFTAGGQGYTSDIVRAIYYAVWKGAKVLNMSFSRSTPSAEITRAMDAATGRGLIAVASAGNEGQDTLVYPAALAGVMGVASTSNEDARSSFSNYGAGLVWVAAPGEGVVTTYPWGSFAAAWGTSFSTPFVAGAAALVAGIEAEATHGQAAGSVAHAVALTAELGHGRLDLHQAVADARNRWPEGPASAVPDSCETSASDWWSEAQ